MSNILSLGLLSVTIITDFRPPCLRTLWFINTSSDLPSSLYQWHCWPIFMAKIISHFPKNHSFTLPSSMLNAEKLAANQTYDPFWHLWPSCYATNLVLFNIYSGSDRKLFAIQYSNIGTNSKFACIEIIRCLKMVLLKFSKSGTNCLKG